VSGKAQHDNREAQFLLLEKEGEDDGNHNAKDECVRESMMICYEQFFAEQYRETVNV
jgi:hypothetical protein